MQVGILGPVEVRIDGNLVPLGGRKQRALLALLLVRANEVVSRDALIDGLWGEEPPATARRSLESHISRLRGLVGPDRLERLEPGYRFRVGPGELDIERFETLLAAARRDTAAGEHSRAAASLAEALVCWRGTALADVLDEPFAPVESARLEERRLLAVEERNDALLALGGDADVIPELERLVTEHPYRERLLGQLVLALYRAGRQADALAAYQLGRRRLADDLGLVPGAALRALEVRILQHDPALLPESGPVAVRKRRRPPPVAILAAAAAVVIAIVVGIELGTRGTSASPALASANAVSAVDDSGAVHVAELGDAPSAMAYAAGSLWVAQPNNGAIVRLDPKTQQQTGRIPVAGGASAIAAVGGAVWVASVPGEVVARIDPTTETVTQTLSFGDARVIALAAGDGLLWVAATDGTLRALDPATGKRRRTFDLGTPATAVAVGHGAAWVVDASSGMLTQLDVMSGKPLATFRVGGGPAAIAVGDDAVWVANSLDATVSRVDIATSSVAATPVGSFPDAIVVARRGVYVANGYGQTVSRLDPASARVVDTMRVRGGATALAGMGGKVYVGTRELEDTSHRGGTLVLLHTRPLSIDPALNLDIAPPQSDGLTRDGLVATSHAGGSAGLQIVPDLAISIPVPIDAGKTYVFRLRRGIRYSNGEPVRAADFRLELERLFRLGSPGTSYFTSIVGTERCNRAQCDLSRGVVVDDATRTVTFHLRSPDPNFLTSLTIGGLASAVPAGTPLHDVGSKPIPGTGPYKIAVANNRQIVYVRNPRFREWSHAAQPDGNPDRIVMRFGLQPAQEARQVERGLADYSLEGVPAAQLGEVRARYASQVHSFSGSETDFLQFNTRVAPFNDVRVRRAVNLAIDRRELVRRYGGSPVAAATCQILPPGLLGFRRYCPYTREPSSSGRWLGPDVAAARRLVAASGTRGEQVTVWGSSDDPIMGHIVAPYAVTVLRKLGYRATLRLEPSSYYGHVSASFWRRVQITSPAWADSSPYNFIATWFRCASPFNHGWFCNATVERRIDRATAVQAVNPQAAGRLWAALDRKLVEEAAWVPVVNVNAFDFVSARARNYQHIPFVGLDVDQLWLK